MTKKTIEQAYEELRQIIDGGSESFTHDDAVEYLKEKLKPAVYEPEQEPVAYQDTAKPDELVAAEDWENIDPMYQSFYRPLYTTPPQRKPLTDEQADSIINGLRTCLHLDSKRVFLKTWLCDWAAHGIKE